MLNQLQSLENRKRVAIVFVLVALTGGCDQTDVGIIRFGLAAPAVTLDPRYATDATSYRITRLIYQTLVDFDETHRAIPALAKWEALTPLHYRFYLREGQRFHDGSILTSDDVVATYKSVLDARTASPHRGSLSNVESIGPRGPLIVDFHLGQADPLFPGLLVIGIMPERLVDESHSSVKRPIGSGPFAVEGVLKEARLRLRRVSDGQLVDFVTVRDATVRALKILHGEIDLTQGSMTPELVDWLSQDGHIMAVHRPGTTFTYLGFNLHDSNISDLRVRRAIAHAIDRQSLIKYMFGDRARLAQGIFTPKHWAGNSQLEAIEFDPRRARELLAAAGFSEEKPLRLKYKTSSDPFRLRIATAIQDQLAGVGVELTILSYDWGTFYGDVKAGRFQMYSLSWVGLKQPDIFRYAFHSSSVPPQGANRGRYLSGSVDQMIELADATNDLEARATLYRQIQKQLLVDLPYIPLWYEDTTLIIRDSIIGYETERDGYYDRLVLARRLGVNE